MEVIAEHPVAFIFPFLVLSGALAIADACVKLRGQHVFAWALFSLFCICFPVYALLEAAAVSMYLHSKREDVEPSIAEVKVAVAFPGIAGVIWRLVVRYIAWAMVGIVVGIFVYLFVAVLARFGSHDLHSGHRVAPHQTHPIWIHLWLIAYVAVLSRYAFTMPMVAKAKRGGSELIGESVALWRQHRWTMCFVAIMSMMFGFASYWTLTALTARSLISHKLEIVWKGVNVLIGAVMSAYYCVFKAILMEQAVTEKPSPVAD